MDSFFLAKYCKQTFQIHLSLYILLFFSLVSHLFDNEVGFLIFYTYPYLYFQAKYCKQTILVSFFFGNTADNLSIFSQLRILINTFKLFEVRINNFLSFPVAFVNIEMKTDKTNIIKRSKRVESCCP